MGVLVYPNFARARYDRVVERVRIRQGAHVALTSVAARGGMSCGCGPLCASALYFCVNSARREVALSAKSSFPLPKARVLSTHVDNRRAAERTTQYSAAGALVRARTSCENVED